MADRNGGHFEEPRKKSSRVDDSINFLSICSLQEMAMINIVTCLCKVRNLDGLNALYKNVRDRDNDSYSTKIKDCRDFLKLLRETKAVVESRLVLLGLPVKLEERAVYIIEPIIYHILHWLNSEICVGDSPEFVDSICWTSLGTVHARKTLESLLTKHNPGTIVEQFTAAAHACAEDLVVDLWQKMPRESKATFVTRRSFSCRDEHLVAYWVFFCIDDLDRLMAVLALQDDYEYSGDLEGNHRRYSYDLTVSVHRNMCDLAVELGNLSAIDYFWSKLDDEERDSDVRRLIESTMAGYCGCRMRCKTSIYISYVYICSQNIERDVTQHLDIGIAQRCVLQFHNTTNATVARLFLISNLKCKEHQEEVLRKYKFRLIYSAAMTWPFQKMVSPLITPVWNDLNPDFFAEFLRKILPLVPLEEIDGILYELWHQSPVRLRKKFIKNLVETYDWNLSAQGSIGPRGKPIKCLRDDRCPFYFANIVNKKDVNHLVKHGHPKIASMIVKAVSEDQI